MTTHAPCRRSGLKQQGRVFAGKKPTNKALNQNHKNRNFNVMDLEKPFLQSTIVPLLESTIFRSKKSPNQYALVITEPATLQTTPPWASKAPMLHAHLLRRTPWSKSRKAEVLHRKCLKMLHFFRVWTNFENARHFQCSSGSSTFEHSKLQPRTFWHCINNSRGRTSGAIPRSSELPRNKLNSFLISEIRRSYNPYTVWGDISRLITHKLV